MTSLTETATEKLQAVKNWLLAKNPKVEDIPLDLDLVENRLVDSLAFMDFVFFLEELVERELDTEVESVENFRTLRKIEANILTAGS